MTEIELPEDLTTLTYEDHVRLDTLAVSMATWTRATLAYSVAVNFGEAVLAQYAKDIEVAYGTVRNWRAVVKAYQGLSFRNDISFAVAQVLAAQPDRARLVETVKTKRDAMALVAERNATDPKALHSGAEGSGGRAAPLDDKPALPSGDDDEIVDGEIVDEDESLDLPKRNPLPRVPEVKQLWDEYRRANEAMIKIREFQSRGIFLGGTGTRAVETFVRQSVEINEQNKEYYNVPSQ